MGKSTPFDKTTVAAGMAGFSNGDVLPDVNVNAELENLDEYADVLFGADYPLDEEELMAGALPENATITINRPKNLNAFLLSTYRELAVALRLAAEDSTVAVTLLTGSGRFFSSGADVTDAPPTDITSPNDIRTAFRARFDGSIAVVGRALAEHPKVLVVGLNGPAVGYAAAMIAHADIIYASESATVHAPFTALGISPEGGSSFMFAKRMGTGRAMEALLFGRKFTSRELESFGFVNKVFPDADFHAAIRSALVATVRAVNANSLRVTKSLIKSHFQRAAVASVTEEVGVLTERFVTGEPQKIFAALAGLFSLHWSRSLDTILSARFSFIFNTAKHGAKEKSKL
ncbi:hypothetical protein HK104_005273 [Borealophlyctis nickersoniae]|nr:hypothetical protein HK104_005273 [Borealophlyctis nickersoniae]